MVSGTERSDLSSWLQKRARQHTRLMQGQAMAAAAAPASPAAAPAAPAPAAGRAPGFSPHRRQPLLPPPPSPGNDTPLSGITARTRDPGRRPELRAAAGAGGGWRRRGEKPGPCAGLRFPRPPPGLLPRDAAVRRRRRRPGRGGAGVPSERYRLSPFPGASEAGCLFSCVRILALFPGSATACPVAGVGQARNTALLLAG